MLHLFVKKLALHGQNLFLKLLWQTKDRKRWSPSCISEIQVYLYTCFLVKVLQRQIWLAKWWTMVRKKWSIRTQQSKRWWKYPTREGLLRSSSGGGNTSIAHSLLACLCYLCRLWRLIVSSRLPIQKWSQLPISQLLWHRERRIKDPTKYSRKEQLNSQLARIKLASWIHRWRLPSSSK